MASWYSVGLQYFVRAIARMVRGIWGVIFAESFGNYFENSITKGYWVGCIKGK